MIDRTLFIFKELMNELFNDTSAQKLYWCQTKVFVKSIINNDKHNI